VSPVVVVLVAGVITGEPVAARVAGWGRGRRGCASHHKVSPPIEIHTHVVLRMLTSCVLSYVLPDAKAGWFVSRFHAA
jgi:hypothetical protein